MNDDNIQKLVDEAFPERGAGAPKADMWRNIQPRLPEPQPRPKHRNRFWWLLPAGAVSAAAALTALIVLSPESRSVDPGRPGELSAHSRIEQLRLQAPDIYEQNRPAIDALNLAIQEVRVDLERQPDDANLQGRLDYYTDWQAELVSELLQWHEENSDVTG